MTEQQLLEIYLANPWWMIAAFIVFVVGFTLCWLGGLMAALTALGNNRWGWGLLSLVLGPFTGLPYALLYKEATYPKSLIVNGLLVILAALLLAGVGWLVA
ncbi:hypothetical protein [Microbulbifer sp. SAOS-129_SWC]|uniref:hypothetical protein n=1 Tax=Microbulbifer sp. SAOS-129_SWC TaxID=3145235 RepID=UPI00321783A1